MSRLQRILQLLLHLQQKRRVTAEELAQHFGVSQRTIYRDMQELFAAGLPLQATAGSGYQLGDQRQLAPISFSREQALALFTARTLAGYKTSDATLRQLDEALEKIKQAAASQDKELIEALASKTWRLDQLPAENRHLAFRFLEEIQTALASKNSVDIEYLPTQGEAQWRTVEPHGLFYNNQWHLLAWCRLRNDLRDFRVDRIRQLKVGATFKTRKNLPSLADYLQTQNELGPQNHYIIQFTDEVAKILVETKYYYGWVAEKKLAGGWVEMAFRNNSVDYMGRWCMYWLPKARPVSPPELLDFIDKQLAENFELNRKY